jgi:hypothetical protein
MLGPRGTPTSAHPTQKSDAFSDLGSSAMCISCHKVNIGPVVGVARDFEKAKLADSGKSCVGCHCANVEQAFANARSDAPSDAPGAAGGTSKGTAGEASAKIAGDAASRVRKGKSHALQTPRDPTFLARAFEVSASASGGKTIVAVKNAAGHRVPGLIGRKIELTAEALDAQGKSLAQSKLAFDAESYLGLGETSTITLAADAAGVRVQGVEQDPRANDPIPFLDLRLSVAH